MTTCQWRRRSPSMTAILQQYRSPSAESLALFPPLSVISLVEVIPDRECLDLLREAEECLWRDGGLHRTTPGRREPRVVEQYPVSARGLGWNVPIQRGRERGWSSEVEDRVRDVSLFPWVLPRVGRLLALLQHRPS
ncbi:hypothetical protein BHE74_00055471 [Ensete ventricosum]|nr:hypothetical protein BHE74_00055471 [Ensete ventricosum]